MGHVGEELGLVLAGDFELPTFLFDLPEEPSVLNGQRGLSRECLQQLDNFGCKRARSVSNHGEPADEVPLANEAACEQGSVSGPHERSTYSALGGRCQYVRDLDRLLHLRETSSRSFSFADRRREHRLDDLRLEMRGGAWQEDRALIVVLVDDAG